MAKSRSTKARAKTRSRKQKLKPKRAPPRRVRRARTKKKALPISEKVSEETSDVLDGQTPSESE